MQKQSLEKLYCKRQLSMAEIADELNVTQAKVYYWLKKFNIERRSQRDSAYVKQNPAGDPFLIRQRLSPKEKDLLISGLLLYWAEGSKGKEALRITNLDHRMLLLFLKFLRVICRVDDKRLFLYVRVYKEYSLEAAKKYWFQLLNIPEEKIFVYSHTDTRSKKNKQWSRHGIATLEFHNTRLKDWLDSATEDLINKLLGKSINLKNP